MKTVFVFAYYSYKDPVFQSAVLPYLIGRPDTRFVILTWEQQQYKLTAEETEKIEKELKENNIIWKRTSWHSGSFKIVKKIVDTVIGVVLSLYLMIRFRATCIYTEGFPGAIIGALISVISRRAHIIHTFEPHADYMLEAGVWHNHSWEYKLLKNLEIQVARQAHTIITATNAYADVLKTLGVKSKIVVLPSCIDLEFYRFSADKRSDIRKTYGIKENQIAIGYLGKLGGMYMEEEIFELFHACQSTGDRFFFFLFTNAESLLIKSLMKKYAIHEQNICVRYLGKSEVPDYLSALDISFIAVRPNPSKLYCSPIKTGESLACGLPVLTPKGISDDYQTLVDLGIGVTYFSDQPMSYTVTALLAYIDSSDKDVVHTSARRYAQTTRSMTMARTKISQVFDSIEA